MNHLYANEEDEIVAADTAEQAGRFHDIELGGHPAVIGEWTQIPDHVKLTITEDEGPETKTAREWAAECNQPWQVATTYN